MFISPLNISPLSKKGGEQFSIEHSFLLDGVNECFEADDVIPIVSGLSVGTVGIMVNPLDVSTVSTVFNFGENTTMDWFQIRVVSSGKIDVQCAEAFTNRWVLRTDDIVLSNGVWTKIDVVHDGVSPVIYVDGVAVDFTFTFSADVTAWFADLTLIDNCRLGCAKTRPATTSFFNGNLSLSSVLSIPLSAAQIASDYNGGKPVNRQQKYGSNCKMLFNPDNSGSTAQFIVSDTINSIDATSLNLEDPDKTTLTPY